jgi:hypothetical protein
MGCRRRAGEFRDPCFRRSMQGADPVCDAQTRCATFQARKWLIKIAGRDDAQDVVGCLVPLLHPLHNVAAGGDFPIMNMRRMAEPFEFVPDPKRLIAITARIADENIGHAPVLAVVRPSATIWPEMILADHAEHKHPCLTRARRRERSQPHWRPSVTCGGPSARRKRSVNRAYGMVVCHIVRSRPAVRGTIAGSRCSMSRRRRTSGLT